MFLIKSLFNEYCIDCSKSDISSPKGVLFFKTNSKYFKRVLWQVSNGMRAGSDMGIVIRQGIRSLGEEQAIQIQSYGAKLNPLIMFYMLMAVIMPALGITFLIIISSLLDVGEGAIRMAFYAIFGLVVFMQIIMKLLLQVEMQIL